MIGIDLVYLPEFARRLDDSGAFKTKAFNASDLQDSSLEHLAGLWAAKEAVFKAASPAPASWLDIRITYDSHGKPAARIGSDAYELSIAHHGNYAVAIAMRVAS